MPLSVFNAQSAELLLAPTEVGATVATSAAVSMTGWSGVAFILQALVNGNISMLIEESNDGVNYTAVPEAVIVANSILGKLRIVDVYQPTKQYLRGRITTLGSTNIISLMAWQYDYNGREPITPSSSIDQLVQVAAS